MSKLFITQSSEGETPFESYHAVFSLFSSTKNIYSKLAKICGAKFEYSTNEDCAVNTICCKNENETHYCYKDANGLIHDPYQYVQLYNSHGNCLFYALYFSFVCNKTDPKLLIDVSSNNLIKFVNKNKKNEYLKVVATTKQLAYKCFVYNDYHIISWILNLVKSNQKTLFPFYNEEWKSMLDTERDEYGIPSEKKYTFSIFFSQFKKFGECPNKTSNCFEQTYLMTSFQVENWDNFKKVTRPEDNSGIEGGVKIDEYFFDENDKKKHTKLFDENGNVFPIVLLCRNETPKKQNKNNKTLKRSKPQ